MFKYIPDITITRIGYVKRECSILLAPHQPIGMLRGKTKRGLMCNRQALLNVHQFVEPFKLHWIVSHMQMHVLLKFRYAVFWVFKVVTYSFIKCFRVCATIFSVISVSPNAWKIKIVLNKRERYI